MITVHEDLYGKILGVKGKITGGAGRLATVVSLEWTSDHYAN